MNPSDYYKHEVVNKVREPELLKARREADRRLARAITEFEQITRNERED